MTLAKTDDLINTIGQNMKTSAEGSGSPEPQSQQSTSSAAETSSEGIDRGANLLNSVDSSTAESAATEKAEGAEGSTSTESRETKTSENSNVTNPDSWSKDSALKEVKKLREENKASRLKYEQMVQKLKSEMDNRIASKEEETSALKKAKEELDSLKEKEADKKRNLEEKLAHREKILAETKARIEATEQTYQQKLQDMETKLASFQAEAEAQMEVYKKRLEDEVSVIDDKYKPIVDMIVKGAGDSREALVAIQEAKLLGTFEEKKIHVVNNTPGAADGARANKEKLEEAAKAERARLNSSEKIKHALDSIRSGTTNSAFRNR